ncbi:hypothetical protein P9J64_17150 [Deltaproteobacteria bacterium IMCC39524]|jgi:hypothetical protein|nr:hypothetical protein [Deltaproteobacteria bacterium IMCC39524]
MMDNEWYEKKPIRKWHQMSDVERRQELEMISRSQLSKVAILLLQQGLQKII